jgi:hypothetical protein
VRRVSQFNLKDLKTFRQASEEHAKIISHLTSTMSEEEKLTKTARMVTLNFKPRLDWRCQRNTKRLA